ncbi:GNAT family N-acetyltransferase [Paucibacter sp. APW11]|uniref:GNAT family N-acetyltransferase n=1 Tax=Roseateles aquae TaxID=3077235 RepID=A0ABU3PIA5_9BURK|nr:GNAT family N-acetyltransferase [Paucibacter sp. APW11]MDT9002284.1 GNAT family N-acetyltransferase [Paucibacter sp. APW11]
MSPSLHITLVSEAQREPLIDLLCELNAHYHPEAPAARALVREHAMLHLLAPSAPLQLLVASDAAGRLKGLAAYAWTYSLVSPEPERRQQCQLKELFVSAESRGQGLARALMAEPARRALAQGCQRIDWPVQAGNRQGLAFYASLGARQVEDRLSWRLDPAALCALSSCA